MSVKMLVSDTVKLTDSWYRYKRLICITTHTVPWGQFIPLVLPSFAMFGQSGVKYSIYTLSGYAMKLMSPERLSEIYFSNCLASSDSLQNFPWKASALDLFMLRKIQRRMHRKPLICFYQWLVRNKANMNHGYCTLPHTVFHNHCRGLQFLKKKTLLSKGQNARTICLSCLKIDLHPPRRTKK